MRILLMSDHNDSTVIGVLWAKVCRSNDTYSRLWLDLADGTRRWIDARSYVIDNIFDNLYKNGFADATLCTIYKVG